MPLSHNYFGTSCSIYPIKKYEYFVFRRSMFVTKADTLIANTKFDGTREVRFISLQVFLVWGTFTLLNLVVLTTNPRIPNDFYYILKCKGTVCF